ANTAAMRSKSRSALHHPLREMARHHVPMSHVPQLRLGRGVGADGGAALVLVERAARSEAAAVDRLLEVEHPPSGALALGGRACAGAQAHLGVLLFREQPPQDARG